MNAEEKKKEIDINEVAITLEVDSEVIDKVLKGEITYNHRPLSRRRLGWLEQTADVCRYGLLLSCRAWSPAPHPARAVGRGHPGY